MGFSAIYFYIILNLMADTLIYCESIVRIFYASRKLQKQPQK